MRIRLAHHLDDRRGEVAQERLAPAEQPAVPDGPAEDPAQHVAATLVGRQDVVGDEERDRARVVGDDLVAESLGFEALGVVPEDLAHPVVDRREQVRVVVGRDLLDDARDALQAHPGVHARRRQRDERAVRLQVELHEDEVPDLEPARAQLAVVGHAMRPLRELGSPRSKCSSEHGPHGPMSAIRHQFFSSPAGKSPHRTRRSGGSPISSRQTSCATSSVE